MIRFSYLGAIVEKLFAAPDKFERHTVAIARIHFEMHLPCIGSLLLAAYTSAVRCFSSFHVSSTSHFNHLIYLNQWTTLLCASGLAAVLCPLNTLLRPIEHRCVHHTPKVHILQATNATIDLSPSDLTRLSKCTPYTSLIGNLSADKPPWCVHKVFPHWPAGLVSDTSFGFLNDAS